MGRVREDGGSWLLERIGGLIEGKEIEVGEGGGGGGKRRKSGLGEEEEDGEFVEVGRV